MNPDNPFNVQPRDIVRVRNERAVGIQEAYEIALREAMIRMIDGAATIDDLKPVLRRMVENCNPKLKSDHD